MSTRKLHVIESDDNDKPWQIITLPCTEGHQIITVVQQFECLCCKPQFSLETGNFSSEYDSSTPYEGKFFSLNKIIFKLEDEFLRKRSFCSHFTMKGAVKVSY